MALLFFSRPSFRKTTELKQYNFRLKTSTVILELETKENCFTIEFSMRHLQNEAISLFPLRNR
jgi:hypothetical protein